MRFKNVQLPRRAQHNTADPQFPLITIGITCFNAADTIARAVDSALKQDWPNKEIIVMDDASTDGSEAVYREMAKQHPQLRIVRGEVNQGVAAARNRLLAEAQGEFVAFFDDDDESRHDRLTTQWQRITDYESLHGAELVLCYSNRNVVTADETKRHYSVMAIGREAPEPSGPIVAKYVLGCLADSRHVWGKLGSCTLMARRHTLIAVGGFDASFRRCEEWDLAVRAALRGAHFIAVNEPLITQFNTSSDDKAGKIPLENGLKLRRKHRDYLTNENRYLASVVMTYAWFHANNRHHWRSRLFQGLAYGLMPSIFASKVASRIGRVTARHPGRRLQSS
jgi:glycosyltransferase involved in cell wall biosynthesis